MRYNTAGKERTQKMGYNIARKERTPFKIDV